MTSQILDAAFKATLEKSIVGELNAQEVQQVGARLVQQFPEANDREIADSVRRAKRLIGFAIDLAEHQRNPKAEAIGKSMEEECPGFSPATYSQALGNGLYVTK